MSHVSGLMGTAANVQLNPDGSVALATGCVDIGQGSDTVMVASFEMTVGSREGRASLVLPFSSFATALNNAASPQLSESALRKRRKVTLTLEITDDSGNATILKRTLKLKAR